MGPYVCGLQGNFPECPCAKTTLIHDHDYPTPPKKTQKKKKQTKTKIKKHQQTNVNKNKQNIYFYAEIVYLNHFTSQLIR